MHRLQSAATLCASILVPAALAQTPSPTPNTLSTQYSSTHYLASLDGGVYLDLTAHVPLRIERLDLNLFSVQGTTGTVDVWLRPDSWRDHVRARGDWMLAGSGPVVAAGHDVPSACVLMAPIELPPGDYGVALHHRGVMPLYSFAFGTRAFGNTDLLLRCGGSALLVLDSEPFEPRIWNGAIHYVAGGGPYWFGRCDRVGEGCYRRSRSFYEVFSPGTFDLANSRLVMTPNGNGGYDVARGPAQPIALPAHATDLGLTRGTSAFVPLPSTLVSPGGTTDALLVHADGRVMLTAKGQLGGGAPPVSPAPLFAGVPTLAALWTDLAPVAGRSVHTAVDATSGTVSLIWLDVPGAQAPNRPGNTFAVHVRADGSIAIDFGSIPGNGGTTLVGFGAGHGARDGGATDLTSSTPFATAHDDAGLQLDAEGRPVLGATFTLLVQELPRGVVGSAVAFAPALATPALDLGAVGAPGCMLFVDTNGAQWIGLGSADRLTITVPPLPTMLGTQCAAQSAALVPGANALGVTTSNGLALAIGSH